MAPQEKKSIELSVDEVLAGQEFEGEKRRFPESLIVFAKHKRLIVGIVASAIVLSVVVSLLLPKSYTAVARILPPQQSQSMASAMLGQLGSIAPLLAGATGGLGLRNPNDMYVAMLRSRTVADHLVDRFSLMSVYKAKLREDTEKLLESKSTIAAGKDGIISISVEDRDPRRAAAIANGYVEELGKLTETLAISDASKRRIFFEREAKDANQQLTVAEQSFKQTEEKTGIIQIDSQAKVMLESYGELRAAVTAKEVEVQAMRQSFASPDNPDLVRVQHELEALKTQLAHYEQGQGGLPITDIALEKVPARALEYIQKYREVKYRESLLELMLKQYELARIDESKDYSLIQVLDPGQPPERRSWPKRTAIVLASTILGSILALVAALFLEKMQRAREDPQFAAQLQLFKFYLRPNHKP